VRIGAGRIGDSGDRAIDLCSFVACATSRGVLKMWDVSRREPKLVVNPRRFERNDVLIGEVTSIKVSSNGASIALLSRKLKEDGVSAGRRAAPFQPPLNPRFHPFGTPLLNILNPASFRRLVAETAGALRVDSCVHVYDVEADAFHSYDCGEGRVPMFLAWDPVEPRLLAVEVKCIRGMQVRIERVLASTIRGRSTDGLGSQADGSGVGRVGALDTLSLLVTVDMGLLLQDSFALAANHAALLGLTVPNIFFASKPEAADGAAAAAAVPRVKLRVMRDFVGMEEIDEGTRKALLDFSYHLTVGNMDAAYKAVKLIKSASVTAGAV
jgi:intraflagellar transport protein 140